MAGLFVNGIQRIMRGEIDLVNDEITAVLVDLTKYTPDLDTDSSQEAIPEAAMLCEVELTGRTLDGTTFRADSVTFTGVESGTAGAVVICKNSDAYSTSPVLALLDDAPEFPIEADGQDIVVNWDTGEAGIFSM